MRYQLTTAFNNTAPLQIFFKGMFALLLAWIWYIWCLVTIQFGLNAILPLIQIFIVGFLKIVIFRVGCHKEMGEGWGGDSPVLLLQKETWSADHPAPPFLYLLYICNAPHFYIYTLLYIYNMYKSYLQHMSEQSICPAWWSRNLTSSLRCHCSVRGVLASAGVLIRKRKIAKRMLIETLKKYPDWLLLSVSKSTDHNT